MLVGVVGCIDGWVLPAMRSRHKPRCIGDRGPRHAGGTGSVEAWLGRVHLLPCQSMVLLALELLVLLVELLVELLLPAGAAVGAAGAAGAVVGPVQKELLKGLQLPGDNVTCLAPHCSEKQRG